MSDKIGPLTFGEKEGGEVFLGRDMGHVKNYSESMAVEIDNEIRRIVKENYQITTQLLKEHQDQLNTLAEALLERETLDASEIKRLVFPERYAAPVADEQPAETEGAGE
jgi:cell division protease FtsH